MENALSTDDENSSTEASIGYRQPPVRTRFKAGVSGNPNGRPKSASLREVFLRAAAAGMDHSFAEYVRADPVGTKLEAVISSLFRQAHYGDQQAIRRVLALHERYAPDEEPAGESA